MVYMLSRRDVTVWPIRPGQFRALFYDQISILRDFGNIMYQTYISLLAILLPPSFLLIITSSVRRSFAIASGPVSLPSRDMNLEHVTRRVEVPFGDCVLIRAYMPVHIRGGQSSLKSQKFYLLKEIRT